MIRKPWMPAIALCGCVLAIGLAGCGTAAKPVSFAAARSAPGTVTVEGRLDFASLRRITGQPTEFRLQEATGGDTLAITAPAGVAVPSNVTTAVAVIVSGKWDAAAQRFIAADVDTRQPGRGDQPRG
jgi:hypothetical protein